VTPPRGLRRRLAVWVRRYLPAEIAGTLMALAGAWAAFAVSGDRTLAAVAGAWAENLGYYGTVGVRDLRRARREADPGAAGAAGAAGRLRPLLGVLGGLLVEFGPAEVLDSFVVRPLAMVAATRVVPDLGAAVVLGKLAADLVFYVPTIAIFELRRRRAALRGDGGRAAGPGP
jgi:hypothetical protein